MHKFTDNQNREWAIAIGLATARHLKEQTGGRVDFVEQARTGHGKEVFQALATDIELLGQVAWLLCEAQAVERGVSELDFADGFSMDVLDQFQTALIRAAIDFFPSRSRPVLQKALEVAERNLAEDTEFAVKEANKLMANPHFEKMIRKTMRTPGVSSGSGPDTSDSDLVISSTLNPS